MCWYETAAGVEAIASTLAIIIGGVVLHKNWHAVVRDSLHNKQLDELLSIRQRLHDVWRGAFFCHHHAANIKALNRSVVEFEREQPDDWREYQEFKQNCQYLSYIFAHTDYCLFPRWFPAKDHQDLTEWLRKLAPFTMNRLMGVSGDELKEFLDILLNKISAIDAAVRKNVR